MAPDAKSAINLSHHIDNSISSLPFYALKTMKKFLAWDFFPL